MDLKLKDVAELLNVSEPTIRRWISDGKIPYYRLDNQLRFSRNEIESWLLSCKQEGEFSLFHEKGRLEQKRIKVTKYEKEEHLAMTVANHTKKMDFSQ